VVRSTTGEHDRVTVTLATGIPEDMVRAVNLDYLDRASVDVAAYREDPDTLVVPTPGRCCTGCGT
jgi:lactate racemase